MADEDRSEDEFVESLLLGDDSEALFIAPHAHDPERLALFQNFDFMLGAPGEELVLVDGLSADPAHLPAGDSFFDLDGIIAAAGEAEHAGARDIGAEQGGAAFDIALLLEDASLQPIDLDRIFDTMRQGDGVRAADGETAAPSSHLLDALPPAPQFDIALADAADGLLPDASIELLFRSLMPADES